MRLPARTAIRAARAAVTVLAVAGLALGALPPLQAPAVASAGLEAEVLSRLNGARADAGVAPLAAAGDLTSVARRHSTRMADQSHLHHNPNLTDDVTGWRKVGENVGRGPSVNAIHNALMNSTGHRRNMLDADFTQVGIGVVSVDGQLWITQVFRTPSGQPPPAPAPAPTPEAAPEPDPERAPAPNTPSRPAPAPPPTAAPAPTPGAGGPGTAGDPGSDGGSGAAGRGGPPPAAGAFRWSLEPLRHHPWGSDPWIAV